VKNLGTGVMMKRKQNYYSGQRFLITFRRKRKEPL